MAADILYYVIMRCCCTPLRQTLAPLEEARDNLPAMLESRPMPVARPGCWGLVEEIDTLRECENC